MKTLCLMEKNYPSSFFDIMVHLIVHLVCEVQLCGLVYLRWMYPFERFMKILKGYVRNRNRLEGCIAECYIAKEAVEYCSEYLSNMKAVGIPSMRNECDGQESIGKPLSSSYVFRVDAKELEQAHLYVLENTIEVEAYIE